MKTNKDKTMNKKETKTVLTEAEKKAKRAEYARAYYASHKEKMIAAVRKCQAKNKAEKEKCAKHAIKPAKKAAKPAKTVARAESVLARAMEKLGAAHEAIQAAKERLAALKDEVAVAKAALKQAKAGAKAK